MKYSGKGQSEGPLIAVAACYLPDANAVGEIFNFGRAILLWEGRVLPMSLLLVVREALIQEGNISSISLAAGLLLGSSLRQASTMSLKYFGMLPGNEGSAIGSA